MTNGEAVKLPHLPLAAFMTDANGKIACWNRACEETTGYSEAQVRGQDVGTILVFEATGEQVPFSSRETQVWSARLHCVDGKQTSVCVNISGDSLEADSTFTLILLPEAPLSETLIRDLPIGEVIEQLPGIFYVVDTSAHLILWNHQLEAVLEMDRNEMSSLEVKYFFDEKERPAIVQKLAEAFEQGHSSIEAELVGKHGKRTPFLFHCTRTNLAGQPCIFGTGLDISARKKVERGLLIRERALYSSVNAVVITCYDKDENRNLIEYVNPAFEQMTGYTLAEIKGSDPRFMRIDDCDIHEHQRIREAIHQRRSVRALLRNQRKNGEVFWNDLRIDPVTSVDGEVTHFVAVLNDVTETRHYERRLHHLAHHDPLTGLANRVLLLERLKEGIEDAVRGPGLGALAFLDLDNFKHINDNFGHDAGDAVLREVAERLRANLREEDTVARFGGDEFVLLINKQPSLQHVADLLERIRQGVSAPIFVQGHEIVPSTSIGVSVFPHDGENVDGIMRAADAAMYHAKSLGKNNVQFYSSDLGEAVHQHLLLQASLSRAITSNELVLDFQPKVDLQSGRIVGAEALVRWQRPEHGTLAPDSFIPVAEETGLIVPLGEWVLNEACKALNTLAKAGIDDVVISINLSPRQLRNRQFVKLLSEILALHQVAAHNLELEVTESQLMDNPADARDALQQLKRLGVRLSIDDFGIGYSSLSQLRNFPVDYIKIDRSFLTNPYYDDHAVIPRAIIALGHNLKLQVVAEGVETREQLQFLLDHDCDQMQGFYFSPAVSYDRLQEMILQKTCLDK